VGVEICGSAVCGVTELVAKLVSFVGIMAGGGARLPETGLLGCSEVVELILRTSGVEGVVAPDSVVEMFP
jgi:hypothetical protein